MRIFDANVTGSLHVSGSSELKGNLVVSGSEIITGLLEVQGNTKIGDEITDVHTVTGSLLVSGLINSSLDVTAQSFIKTGGLSTQFLKADGSIDGGVYLTSHPSVSAATSSDNSGRTYIQDVFLDSFGHITGITTATETVVDTNNFTTGATFNIGNGVVTFTKNDATTYNVNLDGRFLTGYTETDTLDSVVQRGGTTTATLTAPTFRTAGGNNAQFVKGDGSLDGNLYLTSHPSVSAAGSSNNSGRTYIQDILLDSFGHITGITTATETVVDTNNFTTGVTFNTSDGVVTFTKNDGTTYNVDLDGRYGTSSTDFFTTGATFNTSDGVVTFTKNDGTTYNVDLDGRYQSSGNYITALTGEVTASGPGSVTATLLNSAVIGKVLTGLNLAGGGTINSTDSILVAFGKTQNQISALVGGVMYEGVWDATSNTPPITSGVGSKGEYYVVNVKGITNIDGITSWEVGDWIIFNGTTWDKVDNTDAVSSVNGFTGAVSLTTAHVAEVTNLYYTEGRVNANTNVAANTAARHDAVTIGTGNGLSLSTQVISLALAGASTTGALSSTDWNTFNNKQNTLTNPVTGTGTTNFIPKFTGASAIGDSQIFDNGTIVGIGTATLGSWAKLQAAGNIALTGTLLSFSDNLVGGSTPAYLDYNYSTGKLIVGSFGPSASGHIVLETGGTEKVRITSAGNVGIGTTAPGYKLEVNGSAGGSPVNIARFTSGVAGGGTRGMNLYSDGVQFKLQVNDNVGNTGDWAFLNLNPDGGNVGIGTTAPADKLYVGNTAGTSISISTNQAAGFIATPLNIDLNFRGYADTKMAMIRSWDESANTGVGYLTFWTNNSGNVFTEKMRITPSGNVGIGTTSPSYKLDVRGNLLAVGPNGGPGIIGIWEAESIASTGGSIVSDSSASGGSAWTTNGNYQLFGPYTNLPRGNYRLSVRVKVADASYTGNAVRINVYIPSVGSAQDRYIKGIDFSANDTWEMFSIPFNITGITANNVEFYVFGLNSQNISVDYLSVTVDNDSYTAQNWGNLYVNGNVGIGTTSPAAKLHTVGSGIVNIVQSSNTVSYTQYYNTSTSNGSTSDGLTVGLNGLNAYVYLREAGSLILGTSDAERLTITSAGNVGIGTTSPLSKLHIETSASNPFRMVRGTTNFGFEIGGGAIGLYDYEDVTYRWYVDSVGNVGIGTTSPNRTLTVNGIVGVTNGTANTQQLVISTDANGAYLSSSFIGSSSYVPMIFETGGAERLRITSAGNVGIGTTSPNEILSVAGNIELTQGANRHIYIGSATNYYYRLQSVGDDFQIQQATTPVLTIKYPTGNVGINTTAPNAKLNVFGTGGDASVTVQEDLLHIGGNELGGVGGYAGIRLAGTASSSYGVYIRGVKTLAYGNYWNDALTFSVTRTNTETTIDEAMRITSDGNVGIGTTSPVTKLQVVGGSISIDADQPIRKAGDNSIIGYSSALPGINIGSGTATDMVVFNAGGVERVRINTSGNVGIGTTSPGYRLDVAGTIGSNGGGVQFPREFRNDFTPNAERADIFFFSNFTSNNALRIGTLASSGGTTLQSTRANDSSLKTSLLLNPDGGNVGIGTTSPSGALHVYSSGSERLLVGSDVSVVGSTDLQITGASRRMSFTSGTGTIRTTTSNSLILQTNSTTAITIDSSQNVGIGTTSPGAKLDVVGSFRVGSNGMSIDSSGIATTLSANTPWSAFRNSHPQNIIPNGDLESWTSGTSTAPDGYGGYDLGASTIITRESSVVKQGTYSAKIRNGNGGAFAGMSYIVPRVDKTPNSSATSEYTISFWFYAPTSNGSASHIGIYSDTAAGYVVIEQLPTSSGWTFYSRTFSIRDDSNFDFYWWVSWGAGTINDVLYVDSIAFNKGTQIYENTQSSVSRTGNVTRWGDFYNLGGNVGIGTTSPTTILELGLANLSNPTNNQFLRVNAGKYNEASTSNLDLFNWGNNFGQPLGWRISSATDSVGISVGRFLSFSTVVTDGSGNVSTASERLRITSGGNVGIGTTAPANTLQIGSVGATGYSGNKLAVGDGTNAVVLHPGAVSYLTANGDLVVGAGGNATNQLYVKSGGNVGIGTTIPGSRLQVTATSNSATTVDDGITILNDSGVTGCLAGIRLSTYGDSDGGLYPKQFIGAIRNSAGGGKGDIVFLNKDASDTSVVSASDEKMRITAGGNVGIGTTSPTAKLQVDGDIITGNASILKSVSGFLLVQGATNLVLDGATGTVNIRTNSTDKLVVTNAGNVGIGTTSPSNKLEVVGGVTIGTPASSTVNLYLTRTNGGITADANYFVSGNNTPNHTWIEGGYYTGELSGVVTAPNSGYPYIETYSGQGGSTTKSFGFINKTSGSFTSADVFITMSLLRTGRVTFNKYGVGTFTGTATQRLAVDASGNVIEIPIGSGPVDGNGTANYVTKWSDADTITNSIIYDNGTNVGIGTTSPVSKLNVIGNVRVSDGTDQGYVYFRQDRDDVYIGEDFFQLRMGAPSGVVIETDSNGNGFSSFNVTRNTSSQFYIADSGNVGIGTTSPGYKLDVVGAVNSSTATTSGTGTLNLGTTVEPRIAGQITGTQSPSYSSTGKLGFSVTTWGVGSDYGLTEVMAIDMRGADTKSPTIWMNPFGGSVGIGTTTPVSSALSIQQDWVSGSATVKVYPSTAMSSGGLAGYGIFDSNGTTRRAFLVATSSDFQIWGQSNVPMTFATNDTERMRITSAGNVLIGTTTDVGFRLNVNGSIGGGALTITSASQTALFTDTRTNIHTGDASFKIQNTGDTSVTTLSHRLIDLDYAGDADTVTGTYVRFLTAGTERAGLGLTSDKFTITTGVAERLTIDASGNVGIGTTSPASLLYVGAATNFVISGRAASVVGSADSETILTVTKSGTDYPQMLDFGVNNGGLYSTISARQFTADENRLVLQPNGGNVGIGTTSPAEKLHVDGNIRTTQALLSGGLLEFTGAWSASPYNGSTWIRPPAGVGVLLVNNAITKWVGFKPNDDFVVNSDNLLVQSSTGNVGIGTDNPSERLHVQGNIRVTKTILSNQENLDVDSGATRVIATIASATYDGAFFDFVIKKGTNLRAGTVYSIHNGTTVEFTETSTNDLGDTGDVTLSVDLSGGNIRLLATTLSNDWIIKVLVRGI